MTTPETLQRVALRLFRIVNEDPVVEWDDMSSEERQDALVWAQEAVDAMQEVADGPD